MIDKDAYLQRERGEEKTRQTWTIYEQSRRRMFVDKKMHICGENDQIFDASVTRTMNLTCGEQSIHMKRKWQKDMYHLDASPRIR